MGTFLSSLPNIVIPTLCSTKLSPIWGMTPMPQGPLWAAASGFGGSGFFAAGLAGIGLAGEGLVGEGLGAAVGTVCARAGWASASASHKAILWITFRSAVSTRFDRQNCNRQSVRLNRAPPPNKNAGAQSAPLRAASFRRDSRRSLRWSESDRSSSSSTPIDRQRESRRRRRSTAAGSIAPRVAVLGSVFPPHGRAAHSLTDRNIRSRSS